MLLLALSRIDINRAGLWIERAVGLDGRQCRQRNGFELVIERRWNMFTGEGHCLSALRIELDILIQLQVDDVRTVHVAGLAVPALA